MFTKKFNSMEKIYYVRMLRLSTQGFIFRMIPMIMKTINIQISTEKRLKRNILKYKW